VEIKQMKKILIGGVVFGVLLLAGSAGAKVKLDENFKEEFGKYLSAKSAVQSPFVNQEQEDMEMVYPYHADPLNDFDLSFDSQGRKNYNAGDQLKLNGSVKFTPRGEEEIKKLTEGCENCKVPPVYNIPLLDDVGIYVQIWRRDEQDGAIRGDYLIDEFHAAEGLTLRAGKAQNFSVEWQIPGEIKGGQYYLSFFIDSNKRFNLKGMPLVVFLSAADYDFYVTKPEEAGNGVELDKDNILINDESYVYRQPAPTVEPKEGEISVVVPLVNLNTDKQEINVRFELNGWGQGDPADSLLIKKDVVTLEPGEIVDLIYVFNPDNINSVYNLKAVAAAANSISTSNVRFVVKDKNRGLFGFLGVAEKDNSLLPMFCLRNAQWIGTFDGKVKVTKNDFKDNQIASWEKTGSMEARDRCFVIKDQNMRINEGVVKLKGEIYNKEGKVVDTRTVMYNLRPAQDKGVTKMISDIGRDDKATIILALAILLLLSGGIFFIISAKSKQ